MPKLSRRKASLALAFLILMTIATAVEGLSQLPPGFSMPPGVRMDADKALDRALQNSTLTSDGEPFHVVMEISSQENGYSGKIELWWVNEMKYRLDVRSPNFSQVLVVNEGRVSEQNTGDYYPRWLENFVLAMLNPLPMAKNFRDRGDAVVLRPNGGGCLSRNDRPGGITDEMTRGTICFKGDEPLLSSVQTFNVSMEYSEWHKFGKKKIASMYKTDVLSYLPVTGHLTLLEKLRHPDEAMFVINTNTPGQRIATVFVSTLKEESMIEQAPKIDWPTVREGKTDGYMIIYARTDATGQVRETAKHNSDQPGLEQFGMEQALKLKFKPLTVDGVAKQMEMPLVLHFTTHIADALPILTVEQMKKQMPGCSPGRLPPGSPAIVVRVSVNEMGKMTGVGVVKDTTGSAWLSAVDSLESCRYLPYVVDGVATYYKGDVELTAP